MTPVTGIDRVEQGGRRDHLTLLNGNAQLNLQHTLSTFHADEDEDENSLYSDITIDSQFYDTDSFITKFRNHNKPIFLNINIQSLNSKYEKLKNFVLTLTNANINIDVIAIQETWLVKYPHLLLIPGFQPLTYINRNRGRGGGVGFYVKNGINVKIEKDMTYNIDKIFEAITLDISYNRDNLTKHYKVTNIYRSPTTIEGLTSNQQHEEFQDRLETLLSDLNNCNCDAYIFLDANINLLDIDTNPHANQYFTNLTNSGFLLTNFRASRIQNNCSTLIDHILTNSKTNTLTSGSIIEDISDHFITFLQPNILKCKSKPLKVKHRIYSKTNLENFKRDLYQTNWDEVINTTDVNDCYEKFWSIYTQLHDNNFPFSTGRFNRNFHRISDFMTTGLLISRRTKIKLHKIALTDNVPFNWTQYRTYRNIFNKMVKASKKMQINYKIETNSKNPKKMWEILKDLTIGKSEKETVDKIRKGNQIVSEPHQIADEFNSFFTKAGRNIADSVEPITRKPADFLQNTNPPQLRLDNVSQHQIIDTISAMDSKASVDASGVNMKMLKFIKYQIALPLSHLFTLSVTTGVFPAKLKTSKTIPIFKAGDRYSCDNYRPISLLSTISKILEKIVANSLVNHLELNDLLYENQFGFLRNRSTVHNITLLTNRISHDINEKKFVIGVFLDLKKAFDCVSHDILLLKLQKLGINDLALKWFTDYLSNRYQYTDIGGCKSPEKLIDISVLQGSILGPILFLCFINDLHLATNLLTLLFADDTVGIDSDHDLATLIDRVNLEIQKLANWFRANRMAVNVGKTKYIVFRPKGAKILVDLDNNGVKYNSNEIGSPHDPNRVFNLGRVHNDHVDKNERSYKFLGILLDEYLSYDAHCNLLCTKLSRSNYIINRVKNILPTKSLKTLYYSLIHPHILYGLPIYSCTTQKNLNKIFKMQKRAVRSITKSKYNSSTNPIFVGLGILPLEHLITETRALLMHSIYHKYSPTALHNIWITNETRSLNHDHDLRDGHHIYIPLARTEHVKRLTHFALPKTWNDLPDSKLNRNTTTFKIFLKNHLLTQLSNSLLE